jgi:hypothetical protein
MVGLEAKVVPEESEVWGVLEELAELGTTAVWVEPGLTPRP